MEQAYDDAKYGRLSRRPYIDMIIPTLVDPSMAPPGKHVISCFVQYAPYHLAPELGTWDDNREAFGDTVVDRIAEFAPNIRDIIVGRQVLTPLDIERMTGLTEGNIFAGRAVARAAVLQPAGPGLRPLPDADPRPLAVRLVDPSGWRDHGRERPAGGPRGPQGARPEGRLMASPTHDVIVVGGGHNGLVCAAYLAKAGLRILVLERREAVGGAVGTSELAPGVRVPTLAHTVGRIRPAIVRDLDLRSHGLTLVAPDVRVFAPQPGETRAVVLRSDVARTAEGLGDWSTADGAAYADFDRLVRSLGGFLADIMGSTPPDMQAPGIGDALAGLSLGRAFRGLGKRDARTVLRVLPMAVADFVAESFESDAVRAAIAWRGVRYASLGPWSGGSTAHLLMDSAGTDGGAAGETVIARGGPGALADALAGAVRAAGGEVRTGADVVAVTSVDGRATGVALASGEELGARAVVGGIDPKRLLGGLVDPVTLGPSLSWRAANIRTPGVVAKVNLALAGMPRFTAAGDDERLAAGPDRRGARHRCDGARVRREQVRPSLRSPRRRGDDPVARRSVARRTGHADGSHVMSVIAQYAPYRLRTGEGTWDDRRESLGDAVISTLESVAPGIGGLVIGRQVITPLDLERDFGLTGGHPLHGEPTLDLFFAWRPLFGHARYRMPVDGLYLAGSGAHPGGGVTGWPGRNAAREILADRKRWPKA